MPNNKLKAWVRYDGQKKIVPSSLILQVNKPKVGTWEEVPTSLCCNVSPSYNGWKTVTGGIAGDGVVLKNTEDNDDLIFTIISPNDTIDNGWVYIKKYFSTTTILQINYNWTSFDDGGSAPPEYDWPIYCQDAMEPFGEPSDITVRVSETPDGGTWNITVGPNEWFSVGIYSDDSCCGRGFLQIEINEL